MRRAEGVGVDGDFPQRVVRPLGQIAEADVALWGGDVDVRQLVIVEGKAVVEEGARAGSPVTVQPAR